MFREREIKYLAGTVLFLLFILACKRPKEETDNPIIPKTEINPEYFAGGDQTSFDASASAYNHIFSNASQAQMDLHNSGAAIFNSEFTELGTSDHDGLGPLFIQSSCVGCHPGNGRSQPPMSEIDHSSGLLMRFSLAGQGPHGEPIAVPGFGTQLQNLAIGSETPEGAFLLNFNNVYVTYADGSQVLLHNPAHPTYGLYTTLPPNVLYSLRLASPVYGLGLLEKIAEADIFALADEADSDGDYLSGKPNFVWNYQSAQLELGRLGWKASSPTIEQQVAGAFNEDMGITSNGYFPIENGLGQPNCTAGIGAAPDVTEETIQQVAAYIRTLEVPAPRNLEDPIVIRGRQLFDDLHCVGCHKRAFTISMNGNDEQTIYPYSDMLLHDMGEVLADGRPDFEASTNEWRTPPLWGIGLTHIVNPNARYLHDGRAATLEEAILWHGGEAYWAIEAFRELSAEDRSAVISFLEAL